MSESVTTGIAKIVEAGTGTLAEIRNWLGMTPEDAADRVESRRTKRMLKDIGVIEGRREELGLSDDTVERLRNDAMRRHGLDTNFANVLALAAPMVEDPDRAAEIDPEWAEKFKGYAEKAFDEDVQRMWGAVLAGEVDNPGTFSKRSMSILSDMSKQEAELFKRACSWCLPRFYAANSYQTPASCLVADPDSKSTYNNGALSLFDLNTLDAIGLVSTSAIRYVMFPQGKTAFWYGETIFLVTNEGESPKKVNMPGFSLTACGLELANLTDMGCAPELEKTLRAYLEGNGLVIEDIKVE